MKYTPADVRIGFAKPENIAPGTIVRETWHVAEGTYTFETVLPPGAVLWAVRYNVKDKGIESSAVIQVPGQSVQEACWHHFTEQRDVSKAPVHFGRTAWN